MRENVVNVTAVTADGKVIRTGSWHSRMLLHYFCSQCAHLGQRARKSAAGYDLTRLLVGRSVLGRYALARSFTDYNEQNVMRYAALVLQAPREHWL
jgi:FAD/FMN-containing dehydrogenase